MTFLSKTSETKKALFDFNKNIFLKASLTYFCSKESPQIVRIRVTVNISLCNLFSQGSTMKAGHITICKQRAM
jgi:hypothetical protein